MVKRWFPFGFKAHRGETFPFIALHDPDYVFHMEEEGYVKGPIARQLAEVARKARNIRIPPGHEPLVAEYYISRVSRSFEGFALVPEAQEAEEGGTITLRKDRIDLSVPRQYRQYDKSGGKMLIDSLKPILFGDSDVYLTEARCQAFFNNESNFFPDKNVLLP